MNTKRRVISNKFIALGVLAGVIALLISAAYILNFLGIFAKNIDDLVHTPIERVQFIDLHGNERSFDELTGSQSTLYFFASWCIPCYPTLTLLDEFVGDQRLESDLVTIALDNNYDAVKKMVNKTGFSGEVWIATDGTNLVQRRTFGNTNRAVPFVVTLDEKTNILERSYSLKTLPQWQAVLHQKSSLRDAEKIH